MAELDIHLFGYPEFLIDGRPICFERRKTSALLAYLALETSPANSTQAGIGREALSAIFWPDCSQEKAGAYLRQSIWEFARLAGDAWIIRSGGMISLDFKAGIRVDTLAFETVFQQSRLRDRPEATPETCLTEMAGLYRGDFMAGFNLKNCPAFDHWQALQAETLSMQLAQALEALTHLQASRGEFLEAESYARRWLNLDALNETAHRALMRILEQSGKHSAALRQFENCRSILMDELGIQPDAETLALFRKLRDQPVHTPARQAVQSPTAAVPSATARPSGTVTFVFTDIQGSTHLWEHQREAMQHAFQRHEEIVRAAMVSHGGYVYKMIGDAFQVAFDTAADALMAALEAQQNLHHEKWADCIAELKVRMALHTGVTEERDQDYVGPALNRVARLLSAGHGGQILLSQAVYQLVRDQVPLGITLRYLGEYQLKDLLQPEQIYQVTAPGLPVDFPPMRADGTRILKLPPQSTPFFGREAELARISAMLSDPAVRLVSLLGIGGCGKTRLALRAAEESQGFKDGVCFTPLANIDSIQGLILSIAEAANLSLTALPGSSILPENAREQLFQYLAGKQMLLVLDNFEQITDCAGVVSDLLATAVGVKVIVTTRHRLNLAGEWVMEVGGLSFPGGESSDPIHHFSAVQLFVNTAGRNSGFRPAPDDWTPILTICQLLEGIPLGLEMAASWTSMLSCAEIAQEIQRNQDFLSSTWRGMPERHRTLRAVFEHSWRLLSDGEQTVFGRLAIFQNGFTREAALVVADATLLTISALIDKALIRRISSGRFEIHPLLRVYAAEKLAANPTLFDEIRAREADYYTEWLARIFEKIKGKEHLAGLTAIRGETANLASSLEWLVQQVDVQRLSRVFPAWILYQVMNDRRFEMQEANRLVLELVNRLRQRAGPPDSLETALLALACATARFFGNYEDATLAVAYQRESLLLLQGAPDIAMKGFSLLLNCNGAGCLTSKEAAELTRVCVHIFEQVGDPWGVAMAFMTLGDIHFFGNMDPADARAAYTRGLHDFTRLDSHWGRALCMTGLMFLERKLGNLEQAYQLGTSGLAIYAEMASIERMVPIRQNLAEIAAQQGCPHEARGYYEANLAYFVQRGDTAAQQYFRDRLAELPAPGWP